MRGDLNQNTIIFDSVLIGFWGIPHDLHQDSFRFADTHKNPVTDPKVKSINLKTKSKVICRITRNVTKNER